MNKKFWLAAVAAFVVFMVYGIVVQGVLLGSYIKDILGDLGRTEEVAWPFLVGAAVVAIVMVFAYPKGYSGGSSWLEGIRLGIFFWLLLGVAEGLFVYGMFPFSGSGMVSLVLMDLVRLLLAGITISMVYGKPEEAV